MAVEEFVHVDGKDSYMSRVKIPAAILKKSVLYSIYCGECDVKEIWNVQC
jgi:hypothetical protein